VDRVVHGFNVDREWRNFRAVGLYHSGTDRSDRTAYFWRTQAIAWLRWAQGRAGLGTAEARAIGRKFALSYLAGYHAAKARGGAR
jgi:hypothetical protein